MSTDSSVLMQAWLSQSSSSESHGAASPSPSVRATRYTRRATKTSVTSHQKRTLSAPKTSQSASESGQVLKKPRHTARSSEPKPPPVRRSTRVKTEPLSLSALEVSSTLLQTSVETERESSDDSSSHAEAPVTAVSPPATRASARRVTRVARGRPTRISSSTRADNEKEKASEGGSPEEPASSAGEEDESEVELESVDEDEEGSPSHAVVVEDTLDESALKEVASFSRSLMSDLNNDHWKNITPEQYSLPNDIELAKPQDTFALPTPTPTTLPSIPHYRFFLSMAHDVLLKIMKCDADIRQRFQQLQHQHKVVPPPSDVKGEPLPAEASLSVPGLTRHTWEHDQSLLCEGGVSRPSRLKKHLTVRTPACMFGFNCMGFKGYLPGTKDTNGLVLMSYMSPVELRKFETTGIAPRERRQCLLCYWTLVGILSLNVPMGKLSLSHDIIIQKHYNLFDQPHGYRKEFCIHPDSQRYNGLQMPLARPDWSAMHVRADDALETRILDISAMAYELPKN